MSVHCKWNALTVFRWFCVALIAAEIITSLICASVFKIQTQAPDPMLYHIQADMECPVAWRHNVTEWLQRCEDPFALGATFELSQSMLWGLNLFFGIVVTALFILVWDWVLDCCPALDRAWYRLVKDNGSLHWSGLLLGGLTLFSCIVTVYLCLGRLQDIASFPDVQCAVSFLPADRTDVETLVSSCAYGLTIDDTVMRLTLDRHAVPTGNLTDGWNVFRFQSMALWLITPVAIVCWLLAQPCGRQRIVTGSRAHEAHEAPTVLQAMPMQVLEDEEQQQPVPSPPLTAPRVEVEVEGSDAIAVAMLDQSTSSSPAQ